MVTGLTEEELYKSKNMSEYNTNLAHRNTATKQGVADLMSQSVIGQTAADVTTPESTNHRMTQSLCEYLDGAASSVETNVTPLENVIFIF